MKDPLFSHKRIKFFLQNIQDAGYTSLQYKIGSDNLQSRTRTKSFTIVSESDDESENLSDDVNFSYELFLQELDTRSVCDEDSSFLSSELQNFCFMTIRNRGKGKCGYNSHLPVPIFSVVDTVGHETRHRNILNFGDDNTHVEVRTEDMLESSNIKYNVKDVIKLLLSKGSGCT